MPDDELIEEVPDPLLIETLESQAKHCETITGRYGQSSEKGSIAHSLSTVMRLAANRIREAAEFFAIPKPDDPGVEGGNPLLNNDPDVQIHHTRDTEHYEAVSAAALRVIETCRQLQREGFTYWTIEMALANTISMGIARTGAHDEHLKLTLSAIRAGVEFNRKRDKKDVM